MKGLRAKKVNMIKEGTLIVAIDIGMASNHGCCTAADGRSTKTFRVDNTREGLDILCRTKPLRGGNEWSAFSG